MKRGMERKYRIEIGLVMTMDERNTNTNRCWNCGSHSDRYSDEKKKTKKE